MCVIGKASIGPMGGQAATQLGNNRHVQVVSVPHKTTASAATSPQARQRPKTDSSLTRKHRDNSIQPSFSQLNNYAITVRITYRLNIELTVNPT